MRGLTTMAQLFVAATEQWTRRALGEPMPDFHAWCLTRGLLGTAADQFEPVSVGPKAATGPDFAHGAAVTFADGSVAVRDLDEVRHGRPADWRALPPAARGSGTTVGGRCVIRGEADAGCWAIEDGWVCRALVALTQRACDCLARAGSRQLKAESQDAPQDAIRFMNDLSGGGSRTREAARLLHR